MRIITIGRNETNDVQFPNDSFITRVCHCQIEKRDDGSFWITDCSVNGTFVNNQRIEKGVPVKLDEYDVVFIGSTTPPLRWKEYFKQSTHIVKERESDIKKTKPEIPNKYVTTDNKPVVKPSPEPAPEPTPTPKPEPVPVVDKKTDWRKVLSTVMTIVSVIMALLGLYLLIKRL